MSGKNKNISRDSPLSKSDPLPLEPSEDEARYAIPELPEDPDLLASLAYSQAVTISENNRLLDHWMKINLQNEKILVECKNKYNIMETNFCRMSKKYSKCKEKKYQLREYIHALTNYMYTNMQNSSAEHKSENKSDDSRCVDASTKGEQIIPHHKQIVNENKDKDILPNSGSVEQDINRLPTNDIPQMPERNDSNERSMNLLKSYLQVNESQEISQLNENKTLNETDQHVGMITAEITDPEDVEKSLEILQNASSWPDKDNCRNTVHQNKMSNDENHQTKTLNCPSGQKVNDLQLWSAPICAHYYHNRIEDGGPMPVLQKDSDGIVVAIDGFPVSVSESDSEELTQIEKLVKGGAQIRQNDSYTGDQERWISIDNEDPENSDNVNKETVEPGVEESSEQISYQVVIEPTKLIRKRSAPDILFTNWNMIQQNNEESISRISRTSSNDQNIDDIISAFQSNHTIDEIIPNDQPKIMTETQSDKNEITAQSKVCPTIVKSINKLNNDENKNIGQDLVDHTDDHLSAKNSNQLGSPHIDLIEPSCSYATSQTYEKQYEMKSTPPLQRGRLKLKMHMPTDTRKETSSDKILNMKFTIDQTETVTNTEEYKNAFNKNNPDISVTKETVVATKVFNDANEKDSHFKLATIKQNQSESSDTLMNESSFETEMSNEIDKLPFKVAAKIHRRRKTFELIDKTELDDEVSTPAQHTASSDNDLQLRNAFAFNSDYNQTSLPSAQSSEPSLPGSPKVTSPSKVVKCPTKRFTGVEEQVISNKNQIRKKNSNTFSDESSAKDPPENITKSSEWRPRDSVVSPNTFEKLDGPVMGRRAKGVNKSEQFTFAAVEWFPVSPQIPPIKTEKVHGTHLKYSAYTSRPKSSTQNSLTSPRKQGIPISPVHCNTPPQFQIIGQTVSKRNTELAPLKRTFVKDPSDFVQSPSSVDDSTIHHSKGLKQNSKVKVKNVEPKRKK